jgi:hypothetical protein
MLNPKISNYLIFFLNKNCYNVMLIMTLMKMLNIEYFSFRRFGTFLDTIH